jgi:hypothetical protein
MAKKKICEFCKKETKGKFNDNLCKDCFNKLENWDIVEINKRLKEFEKLKSKEAIKFLKDEILDLFVKMHQLKDYLVENHTIYEEDFKKFCTNREEYEKEKLEVGLAKVYIVSLQRNKRLREFYLKNKIKGGNFIEIRRKSDFNKISDGDMIYFLSSKDITKEYKEEIKKSGSNWSIKVSVSEKKFKNLNDSCSTHVKSCKDFKKTHRFLKEIIECIALPSLVGLDYADIRQIFMMNSRIELKKYKAKLNEKDHIIRNIKKDFKKIDGCFFVVSGGTDITLDEVLDIAEKIGKISIFMVYGARIEEDLKGKIEVSLFAGWRK